MSATRYFRGNGVTWRMPETGCGEIRYDGEEWISSVCTLETIMLSGFVTECDQHGNPLTSTVNPDNITVDNLEDLADRLEHAAAKIHRVALQARAGEVSPEYAAELVSGARQAVNAAFAGI